MIEIIGGPDRDRTDDLFHAMEARSQLRHRPTMTNLPIFVESARFVKPRRRVRRSRRGDLSADGAAGQSGFVASRMRRVTAESIFGELNRLLPVSKQVE